MKKIYLIVLLSLFCKICNAQLLVENFDYPQGALLTSNGWFTQYGTASSIGVTNGLIFDNYIASNIGNAALLDAEESNHLHKSFNETTSGNIYVAFMFQPTIVAKDGWFFSLRDNKLDYTNFNFNGRLFITTDNKIGLTFGNNANKVYSANALEASKTYLVVLKYTIKEGNNNDEVSLYLFSSIPENEPANPEIGPLTDNAVQDINPANVVLRSYSSYNWLVIDGIRVGTTWEETVKKVQNSGNTTLSTNNFRYYVHANILNFDLTQEANQFAIYDLTGKCLTKKHENLPAGSYTVALKSGVYILKIDSSVKKIIVK